MFRTVSRIVRIAATGGGIDGEESVMAEDVDLFGNPVTPTSTVPAGKKKRPETNDMELIARVLRRAAGEGFAVLGLQERVYRVGAARDGVVEVTECAREEADAVRQLLDREVLTLGGRHGYRYKNNRESSGNAVLVPRSTRRMSARWSALYHPASWGAKSTSDGKG